MKPVGLPFMLLHKCRKQKTAKEGKKTKIREDAGMLR
jgi:hypothetical protein